MSQPVVQFQAIRKSFQSHPVLQGIDLEVFEGEFLTLLGPSGCGKTTLLRLLAGFEMPDAGDIVLDGQRVNGLPPHLRNVNTVFQSYALFPHLTVFDNVAFGLRMKRTPKAEIQIRVMEALTAVQLAPLAQRKPQQLSGGQQQRVALARAVANQPRVLLLDEPLSALDYKLRRAMQVELKALQRQLGITFLFVTHDQEEALSLSDRVVVMNNGLIEQIGPPHEIYEHPKTRFVAEFVGESNFLTLTLISREDATRAKVQLEGRELVLECPEHLQAGASHTLMLRPEDLRLLPAQSPQALLQGTLVEKIYKGMTLDAVIQLASGQRLLCSDFYTPDTALAELGESVGLAWMPGRERFLP